MVTTNQFRKIKIKEIEDRRDKLQVELAIVEECIEENSEEIAEFAVKLADIAPLLKKINERKDRNKAEALELISKRIPLSNTEYRRIENDEAFKHTEFKCPYNEELQRVQKQILKADESIEKWKKMDLREIANTNEFNALNSTISN